MGGLCSSNSSFAKDEVDEDAVSGSKTTNTICKYANEDCEYTNFIFDTDFGKLAGRNVVLFIVDFVVQLSLQNIVFKDFNHSDRDETAPTFDNCDENLPYHIMCEHFTSKALKFPKPRNININMMPFVYGDVESLPPKYRHYWEMILGCQAWDQKGKVVYLTIQESKVKADSSQRRPGVHIETPGSIQNVFWKEWGDSSSFFTPDAPYEGRLRWKQSPEIQKWKVAAHGFGVPYDYNMHWGKGNWKKGRPNGGVYMASNIPESCKIWRCIIKNPEEAAWIHGDISHLENALGYSEFMRPNTMYWMTDRTPHQAVVLKKSVYRQYFRLVTNEVSVWFEDHSTANPLGIEPDALKISGNKFQGNILLNMSTKRTASEILSSIHN